MVAGDACVPLAVVAQRIETMLGFKLPPWRTPSDVVYEMAVAGHNIRPVIITQYVKVFSDERGNTHTFIQGYERCIAYARRKGWLH
jgi:hypothetical protein